MIRMRNAKLMNKMHARERSFAGLEFGASLELGIWSLELLAKARES